MQLRTSATCGKATVSDLEWQYADYNWIGLDWIDWRVLVSPLLVPQITTTFLSLQTRNVQTLYSELDF